MRLRIINPNIQRRTEDAGSGGCPPLSAGCTTDPGKHDLTPAQASSLSQVLAESSASATSTAAATSTDRNEANNNVNPQAVVGIVVIVFLVLAFASAIGYIAFGARGERCCCTRRKTTKNQAVQEGAHVLTPTTEFKGRSGSPTS